VCDRILGTLYGNALGDAYGLATEFMTKKEAREIFGERIPFPNFKRYVAFSISLLSDLLW
jgi:ADP-ribosylglycohydrolase